MDLLMVYWLPLLEMDLVQFSFMAYQPLKAI